MTGFSQIQDIRGLDWHDKRMAQSSRGLHKLTPLHVCGCPTIQFFFSVEYFEVLPLHSFEKPLHIVDLVHIGLTLSLNDRPLDKLGPLDAVRCIARRVGECAKRVVHLCTTWYTTVTGDSVAPCGRDIAEGQCRT